MHTVLRHLANKTARPWPILWEKWYRLWAIDVRTIHRLSNVTSRTSLSERICTQKTPLHHRCTVKRWAIAIWNDSSCRWAKVLDHWRTRNVPSCWKCLYSTWFAVMGEFFGANWLDYSFIKPTTHIANRLAIFPVKVENYDCMYWDSEVAAKQHSGWEWLFMDSKSFVLVVVVQSHGLLQSVVAPLWL